MFGSKSITIEILFDNNICIFIINNYIDVLIKDDDNTIKRNKNLNRSYYLLWKVHNVF